MASATPKPLNEVIESAHTYLDEQMHTVDHAQFKCILAAQSRSVKNTIDFTSEGVGKDEASELLELVWQTNSVVSKPQPV